MKVLQLGVGAIGTVVARHLAGHRAVESLTLGDMDTRRAETLAKELKGNVSVKRIDAADNTSLQAALSGHGLVVSAVLPIHNEAIMKATLAAGCHLLDLSSGGGDELAHDAAWKKAGLTAIHGMGEDPGISNIFARWAADRLDEVESIKVRDGEFSTGDEYPLACLFSTETFIEEAVSPAIYFEDGARKEVPAWSNREVYPFPEPVGPQVVYSMSHEEVDTLPRFIGKGVRFVDFKLAVPDEMQRQLAFLDRIGMTRRDRVRVRGGEVTPLSVLAAVLPQPAELGGRIQGAAIILVEVDGRKAGRRVRHVLYSAMTHDEAFRRMKMTATAFLTGTGAAAGALALVTGRIAARGVLPPEMLEPEPILALLQELGASVHKQESAL
ncbi:MAG TPA: saccharopine dehydrogenase C-terminal domain-containing protein [Candidatus Polarisedimenticolia bacterium]|nr:saccharopine dehydrogenase C-terminal domain-containing protein [Candidatus Polarisedimenticolia bacterium]